MRANTCKIFVAFRVGLLLTTFISASWANAAQADFWLDRARKDIEATLGKPFPQGGLITQYGLAFTLIQMRNNAGDKAMVRDLLKRADRTCPAKWHKEGNDLRWLLVDAEGDALLGNQRLAEALLVRAAAMVKALNGFDRWSTMEASARIRVELGDVNGAFKDVLQSGSGLPRDIRDLKKPGDGSLEIVYNSCYLAQDFDVAHDSRHRDEAMHLAELSAKKDDNLIDVVADQYGRFGDWTDARRVIEALPTGPIMQRSDALIRLAYWMWELNRPEKVPSLLSEALGDVAQSNDVDFNWDVAKACAELDDVAAYNRAVSLILKIWETDNKWRSNYLPRIAWGYAEIGDAADSHKFTELVLALPPQDNADAAAAKINLAAATARLGDAKTADEAVAEIVKSKVIPGDGWDDLGCRVPTADIEAGHYNAAIADARRIFHSPEDLGGIYGQIAYEHCQKKQFDAARAAAANIYHDFLQLNMLREIAQAQVEAGQTEPTAAWIDALSSPRDRAAVDLGVAAKLLGVEHRWTTYLPFDNAHAW